MTPLRVLAFGLLVVVVVLYVLNPGPEKFEGFLREDIAERAAEAAAEAGGDAGSMGRDVGGFIAARIGREVAGAAAPAFERENYHVASVYRVDLNGPNPRGDWAFLGIAGWFIPIEQPEAVEAL